MKNNLLLLFFSVFLLLSSCQQTGIPEEFDYGMVVEGRYTNSFFNCSMVLPNGWDVGTREEMEQVQEEGRKAYAGDDKVKDAKARAADINTANLLMVRRYDDDTVVEFNHSILMNSENLSRQLSIKTPEQYLNVVRQQLRNLDGFPYKVSDKISEVTVNGAKFAAVDAEVSNNGLIVFQRYLTTRRNNFALNIILTYSTDDELAELMKVVNTLKFKGKDPGGSS